MKAHLKSLASGILALSCSTGTPCPTNPTPKCEEHTAAVPSAAPEAQSEYERLKAEDAALDDIFHDLRKKDGYIVKACMEANDECGTRVIRTLKRLIDGKIQVACRSNLPDMKQFFACAVKEHENEGRQKELLEFFRFSNPCSHVLIDCMESLQALKEDPRIAGLTLNDVTINEEPADWQPDENGQIQIPPPSQPLPLAIRSYIDRSLCGAGHPAVGSCWEEKNLMSDKFFADHKQEIASCASNPPKELRVLGHNSELSCEGYILKKYPEAEKAYEHQRALCDAAADECHKRVMEILE